MARLPRVTAAQVIRVLQKLGFRLDRQRGAHRIFRGPTGEWVTVSFHAGRIVKPKTLKSILRDAGLSVEEFTRRLKGP
jgi:predicted RNA binding protein YcfA (HicA-like mRNA interferase family)